MKYLLLIIGLIVQLFTGSGLQAQSSYPGVTLTATPLVCGQNCSVITATPVGGNQTTAYVAQQITYAPPCAFDSGTAVLSNTSDIMSTTLNLPFTFCFFGSACNQFAIGSDGYISFIPSNCCVFCNWEIPGPVPITPDGTTAGTIMAGWQSMDETYHGQIYYKTYGSAPNRILAVSWYDVPMFGDSGSVDNSYCSQANHQTQMMVLYETTNIIEIYIQEKDTLCADSGNGEWNNDLAVEGIVNQTNTVACTVPGRNATKWTASNDAWRFMPAGPPAYRINWFNGLAQTGSGTDTLQVCITTAATYAASVTYYSCNGDSVIVIDTLTLQPISGSSNTVFYDTICASSNFVFNGQVLTQPGNYIDTMSGSFGCDSIITLNLSFITPPNQQLCIVTMDTALNKEQVIWNKANKYATDSFYIYRASAVDTVNYVLIAAIGRDSLSEVTDTGSLPDSMYYRYKINLKDTCGNYSTLSNYHQTIYLQALAGGNFAWTPYIIENTASPVVNYYFYRDSTGTGAWQLLATLLPGQTTAMDTDYLMYPSARYYILATLSNPCNPSRSVTDIYSNITGHAGPTGIIETGLQQIKLLNNPVSNQLTLINITQPVKIDLIDALGEVLLSNIEATTNIKSIPMHRYVPGIYFVKIMCGSNSKTLKVVKY